jgi:CBS domain-containing protein
MSKDLVSVTPEAGVLEAAEIMSAHHLSGLPVIDRAGHLVGILTEGDLLRRWETGTGKQHTGFAAFRAGVERVAADYVRSHGRHVRNLMTADVVTVGEDTELETIVDLLERHGFRQIPVLHDGKVAGLVSRADVLRAFCAAARRIGDADQADDEINRALFAIFTRESWAPLDRIDVRVRNGVVDLFGAVDSETQRKALIVAAESVNGVKEVTDHLKCTPRDGPLVASP